MVVDIVNKIIIYAFKIINKKYLYMLFLVHHKVYLIE